jgi:hypothetical protein
MKVATGGSSVPLCLLDVFGISLSFSGCVLAGRPTALSDICRLHTDKKPVHDYRNRFLSLKDFDAGHARPYVDYIPCNPRIPSGRDGFVKGVGDPFT